MGWYGRRSRSVDSKPSRGNYCFKAFEVKGKTLDEIQTHCSRFSSNLVTNELLADKNSTLKDELDFIMEKKFRLNDNDRKKIFGLNLKIQGTFLYRILS